jgi:KaiC/GvpD/RAD55 family RecA-like ATPase
MIKTIESGIPGFDELTLSEITEGGIPEKSTTLIYGPPKTGKSIFCNQFTYHGLLNLEPCLYVTTDYGLKQVQNNMMEFQWFIQNYIQNQSLYIIDGISKLSGKKIEDTTNIKSSFVRNPSDMMVKIGIGTRFVYKKSNHFRSTLDSLNTLFIFNPPQMVTRVLNAYLRRITEAGGTCIITYTEGIINPNTENILKSLFDNTIMLDGQNIQIKSHFEDDEKINNYKSTYNITDKGIVIKRE